MQQYQQTIWSLAGCKTVLLISDFAFLKMLLYQPKVNSFFLYPSYVPFSKPKSKPKSKSSYIIHFYTFRFLFVFVTYSNFLEHTLILTDFTQQVQFTISITDCLTLCLFLLLFTASFGIVWHCLFLFFNFFP